MAKRAGARDVAPKVRAAFFRAAASLEKKGKPLEHLIEKSLQADFLGTLRTMALCCFAPNIDLGFALKNDPCR